MTRDTFDSWYLVGKGGADFLSLNQETKSKIVRPVGIPKKKVVGLKKNKICTKKEIKT